MALAVQFLTQRSLVAWSLTDWYWAALLSSLAGYALLGKGYAYAGVPPLFVTEASLVAGALIVLSSGCVAAVLATLPLALLACLIVLAVIRTVPYVGSEGVDALRDSVIVLYGTFAVIIAALLVERPERLASLMRFLRWLTGAFVFVAPLIYLTNRIGVLPMIPGWPAAGTPFLFTRAGEVGVHVSGCLVLALLGFRSTGVAWCCGLLVCVALVASQSRGGTLAMLGPLAFALVVGRRWGAAFGVAFAAIALLSLVYAIDFDLPLKDEDYRSLSGRQIIDNMLSFVLPSDSGNLDATKLWRMMWWQKIQDYTLYGAYFWDGKGFGINLAVSDGFMVGPLDAPALRSPHNSHFNILARMGVPGFTLWCLVGLSWLGLMLHNMHRAWRLGLRSWGNLMLFITCYWLSIVIDASFDVALEGPMMGVWFWCLFGLGVGVVMVFQAALAWDIGPVAARPVGENPLGPRKQRS